MQSHVVLHAHAMPSNLYFTSAAKPAISFQFWQSMQKEKIQFFAYPTTATILKSKVSRHRWPKYVASLCSLICSIYERSAHAAWYRDRWDVQIWWNRTPKMLQRKLLVSAATCARGSYTDYGTWCCLSPMVRVSLSVDLRVRLRHTHRKRLNITAFTFDRTFLPWQINWRILRSNKMNADADSEPKISMDRMAAKKKTVPNVQMEHVGPQAMNNGKWNYTCEHENSDGVRCLYWVRMETQRASHFHVSMRRHISFELIQFCFWAIVAAIVAIFASFFSVCFKIYWPSAASHKKEKIKSRKSIEWIPNMMVCNSSNNASRLQKIRNCCNKRKYATQVFASITTIDASSIEIIHTWISFSCAHSVNNGIFHENRFTRAIHNDECTVHTAHCTVILSCTCGSAKINRK